jgi:hypothetical protein
VDLWVDTSVSPEDRSKMLLRNDGVHLQAQTARTVPVMSDSVYDIVNMEHIDLKGGNIPVSPV